MGKDILKLVIDIMTAVGTFGTGIAAVIGVFKIVKNAKYRNEVLYGAEAEERFRKIAPSLDKAKLIGEYPFSGGPTTIIPQLKIMRLHYNPQTMPVEYKGCTQTIRFITCDEKDPEHQKNIEKVWRLQG